VQNDVKLWFRVCARVRANCLSGVSAVLGIYLVVHLAVAIEMAICFAQYFIYSFIG